MINNPNEEPDDEREVSSGSIKNLDHILFSRHFQNNHSEQQSILPTPTNPLDINTNNIRTTPSPLILPKIDPLISYRNSNYPINLCNINVRGFNDPTKQFQFIDHCTRNNFDIIGLSELHFASKAATRSQIFTNDRRYDFYWATEESETLTAGGVGLMINKHLSRHIRSYKTFKDRIIYADLYFKRHTILRIIQVYNPTRIHKELRKEVYNRLKYYIEEGQNKNFQVIVMGDLNENMDDYYDRKAEGKSTLSYNFNLLRLLARSDLLNVQEQFHSTPFTYTWNNKRRIDGTYMSPTMLHQVMMMLIDENPTNFPTDHSMVIVKIKREFLFKLNKQKEKKRTQTNQRRIFQLHNMNDELWKRFKRKTKEDIRTDDMLNNYNRDKQNLKGTMNFINNKLEEILIKAAKEHIPNKIAHKGYRNLKEKNIVIIERFLNKCNRIGRLLHNKIILAQGLPTLETWSAWIFTANSICDTYELDRYVWQNEITDENLRSCRKNVNQITDFLINLHTSEMALTSRRQINEYFKQRCNDLHSNQSRMIDSILERPHRRITLDRVMLDDGSLTLDNDEIDKKVVDHFQNIAGPNATHQSIPEEWRSEYEPLRTISDDCYKDQLKHIDLQELNEILSICPNGKAAGVSGITYEMVRHSSKHFKLKLVELYNICIDNNDTPTKWKHALLFPIPKPMEWECDINNTRPIVLLEIFRKIFIKIITRRLSSTLVEHSILKGGNHAGLPGGSTFEPIRILDAIRTDAITHNKPLFIYFQDMSKAYDRVRLDILRLSMLRLKIPERLIDLILSVFKDRTNAVITEFGTTPAYEILIGIDQGEIISPLLWTIYYDPLLTKLKKNNVGYEISAPKFSDINAPPTTVKSDYTASAFLDDTELFTASQENLAIQLNTTNSFHKFTNNKINNDKAILLTTDKQSIDEEGHIMLTIDGKEVKFKVTSIDEQVRFLGVYFNIKGKRHKLINHIKNITRQATSLMNRKRVTPDHIVYIFNRVLLPRIEFLMQLEIFTEHECNSIMAPIRKLLKWKAGLHSTINNNVLHLNEPYGIKNLFQHQMAVQLDWLNTQFNDKGVLGDISWIRLLQIQYKYWTPNAPLNFIKKLPRLKYGNNLIESTIHINRHLPIEMAVTHNFSSQISGGVYALVDVLPTPDYIKLLSTIRKHRIMFLEQIIYSDRRLMEWNEIKRIYNIVCNHPPKWYQLTTDCCITDNGKLKIEYACQSNIRPHEDRNAIKNNSWVAAITSSSPTILIGKVSDINIRSNTIQLRHYKITETDHALSEVIMIERCTGCVHTTDTTKVAGQSRCFVTCDTGLYVKTILGATHIRRRLNIAARMTFIHESVTSLQRRLRCRAESQPVNCVTFTSPPDTSLLSLFNQEYNEQLNLIKGRFNSCSDLIFYTDGSLTDINSKDVRMGIGWIQVQENTPREEFSAQISNWPSSTRAELIAIVTAIYTCALNSTVTIYTDSEATIKRFHSLKNPTMTNRRKLKIPNNIMWSILLEIIARNKLNVFLKKVKGHSHDPHNDRADSLAKEGRNKNIIGINPQSITCHRLTFKWNETIIEGSIRAHFKTVSSIYFNEQWMSSYACRSIKAIYDQCNWPLTWLNIKFSSSQAHTSDRQTVEITFKTKNLNMTLPTLEFLKLTQPHIYNETWFCVKCQDTAYRETWAHTFLCPSQRPFLLSCIDLLQEKLIDEIKEHVIGSTQYISKELTKLNLWTIPTDYTADPTTRPFNVLDLIRGIVPTSLVTFIRSRTLPTLQTKNIEYIVVKSLSYFIEWIRKDIWIERCDTLKEHQQLRGLNRQRLRQKYAEATSRPRRSQTHHNNQRSQTARSYLNTAAKFDDYIKYGIRPE